MPGMPRGAPMFAMQRHGAGDGQTAHGVHLPAVSRDGAVPDLLCTDPQGDVGDGGCRGERCRRCASERGSLAQALRSQIADLQEKINRCEFNEKMRTLHTSIHGYDPTMGTIDMAQANLKYKYQQLLMQAQQELAELEGRW